MPSSVVHNYDDEKKWKKARQIAEERGYKDNYAYIMGLYKRMKPSHAFKKSAGDVVATTICPICNEISIGSCRCFIGDMRCPNKHTWVVCPVHQIRVVPFIESHSSGERYERDGCWCNKGKVFDLVITAKLSIPEGWSIKPSSGSYIIYEHHSGNARVQDTKRTHPERYQVLHKEKGEGLESLGKSRLDEAFALAERNMKHLGIRAELIRLAYDNPEIRSTILPILKP